MEKVNFSDAGLQQLLQELYLLNQQQLQEEVLHIQTDLRQWLKDHFIFSTPQLEDLDNLGATFLQESATQLGYFVLNRLPVSLYKPETSLLREKKDRGKLYRNEAKTANVYNESLGSSQTETLNFSIEYLSPMGS
ncbi:hypothetical protein [Pedobacter arcticus]|uniref:hypothetical protein n=1 Tax=Pedobacter arcticus TaxID=752140 RepID=UPI0012B5D929|nr:hypothetical protein [Pedobacter arcticus]